MSATGKFSEVELAKPVIQFLHQMGFDLYQEVPLGGGGPRADIVGVLGGKTVAIVECKASLSFDVIAQAKQWDAHWRFVAVPDLKGGASDGRRLALDFCASLGIGVIQVRTDGQVIRVAHYPALRRRANVGRLLAQLRPEHKTFAAAGSSGRYWSPWRDSVHRLVGAVKDKPGMPLQELLAQVKHHWGSAASARGCVARQIEGGIIKDLRMVREGKKLLIYPAEAQP